jgi:hypothetical protein
MLDNVQNYDSYINYIATYKTKTFITATVFRL